MKELHVKYRPKTWDGVIGQTATVVSIQQILRDKYSRAFILVGPSGVGKTTIARLIAREVGIDPKSGSYYELDAATRTGVDDMRELKEKLRLLPMTKCKNRLVCLDEAHMLSKNAWNALLKDVEEPPSGVYWVFCTTEPGKIPAAIRSRCAEYTLGLVKDEELELLLEEVLQAEQMHVSDSVQNLLIEAAQGSPRRLLVGIAKIGDCVSDEEASVVLQTIGLVDDKDIADFCRALHKGAQWKELMVILRRMENQTAEGIRSIVCIWFNKVAMGANSTRDAERALAILEVFGNPYPPVPASSMHPLLLSIGQLVK